jgi:hypothetical protein
VDESGIRVRAGELYRFAEGMRFETTAVFAPAVAALSVPLRTGVPFGARLHEVSAVTSAAAQRYASAVDVSLANMRRFVEVASLLAEAAERVAADYQAADARAAAGFRAADARAASGFRAADGRAAAGAPAAQAESAAGFRADEAGSAGAPGAGPA